MAVFLGKQHASSPGSLRQASKQQQNAPHPHRFKQIQQNQKALTESIISVEDSRQHAATACVCHKHRLCDAVDQRPPVP